ncbi:MAG: ABC transporter ATP-binding protein [Thermotogota bacterium]|nr:ABC transporter ATP-binding protein [Thermotogota bacterium]
MIIAENLKKYYGKYRGVENVSFKIEKNEIYGLIGPNGAGKTTTIRIILGLLKKDRGFVKVGDHIIPHYLHHAKHKIGYLPGEVNFYGNMEVKEFLRFNRRFYKDINREYENELCDYLNIERNKRFKELSQGNRKIVGILQAVVHKPDYLILDEPTNGLDPLLQNKLYDLLEKERERGAAILFSSHNLSEVERLCQRVGIIKNGELIKDLNIDDFSEYSRKLVTIRGLSKPEHLDNFEVKNKNGQTHVYTVKKSQIKEFMKKLSEVAFEDVQIRNPTLEESFMEFYQEEK